MLQIRRITATLAAMLPLAGAFLMFTGANAMAQGGACDEAADIAVLPAPIAPWKGAPLRVIVAAEKPIHGELR